MGQLEPLHLTQLWTQIGSYLSSPPGPRPPLAFRDPLTPSSSRDRRTDSQAAWQAVNKGGGFLLQEALHLFPHAWARSAEASAGHG